MIQPKPKKCKGTGKAKGFQGCGELHIHRKYGLGIKCCYPKWLLNTEEGQEVLDKSKIRAKKTVEKQQKKEHRQRKEESRKKSYHEKRLQDEINWIVRLIDNGQPCISSGRLEGKFAGGHYFAVGSFPSLRYHFFNIHRQTFEQNSHKSGNIRGYTKNLLEVYGQEYHDFILNDLRRLYPSLHLTIPELKEKLLEARKIRKELLQKSRIYSTSERIQLRKEFNKRLNIYK